MISMIMDPQIIAALIVGVTTILAVVIGWWLHQKKSHERHGKRAELDSTALVVNRISSDKLEDQAINNQLFERLISLTNITTKEIVDSINSAPPFQMEQIAEQYKGIFVKWTGHLKEVITDPLDKEAVRVNLSINQDTFKGDSFWFSEKVTNFPEIRSLKRGSTVRVVGEILSASGPGLCVDLKPISIEILENNV